MIIFGGEIKYSEKNIQISILENIMSIGYKTLTDYNRYLDLDVPIVLFYFESNSQKIFNFRFGFFPPTSVVEQKQSATIQTQSEKIESKSNNDIILSPGDGTTVWNWPENIAQPFIWILTTLKPISLIFQYDNWNFRDDIVFKYSLERIDKEQDDISGEINGMWIDKEFFFGAIDEDTLKVLTEGVYNLKVEIVNVTDNVNEILDTDEVKFIVVEGMKFISGINLAAGIWGASLILLSILLLRGDPTLSLANIIFSLTAIALTFLFNPSFSRILGMMVISFIMGFLVLATYVITTALNKLNLLGAFMLIFRNFLFYLLLIGTILKGLAVSIIIGLLPSNVIFNIILTLAGFSLAIIGLITSLILMNLTLNTHLIDKTWPYPIFGVVNIIVGIVLLVMLLITINNRVSE